MKKLIRWIFPKYKYGSELLDDINKYGYKPIKWFMIRDERRDYYDSVAVCKIKIKGWFE